MRKKNNQGFSLVELLVASTIVALLAAAGLVSFTVANRNARNAKRKTDIEQVRAALELYRTEEGFYPSATNFVSVSVTDFSSLVQELSNTDFLSNSEKVSDPRPAPYPSYSYSTPGSCTAYELCVELEPEDSPPYDYCQCNP